MKTLLIFPPQWMPIGPHFSLSTLLGQFTDTLYQAEVMDLNIEFYNETLTTDTIKNSIEKAKKILPELREEIKKNFDKNRFKIERIHFGVYAYFNYDYFFSILNLVENIKNFRYE